MEVLTVIAAALAFAGREAAKAAIGEGVKDAYRAVKEFLSDKYSQVDLTPVEKAPESKARQAVLVEDLTSSGAAADADFSPLAKQLVGMLLRPRCERPAHKRVCSSTISNPPLCVLAT